MIAPDVDNGFTRIANALLDAIVLYPFTKRQMKIVLCVIRKTYGFNKKSDNISNGELARLTGIDRRDVIRTLDELSTNGVLTVEESSVAVRGGYLNNIALNKDYREWATSGKTPTSGESPLVVNHPATSGKSPPRLVANHPPSKDTPKRQTKDKGQLALPEWLDADAWAEFVEFRRRRSPLTDRATFLAIRELEKLRAQGFEPRAVIDQSILNGWRGLFPIKDQKGEPKVRGVVV